MMTKINRKRVTAMLTFLVLLTLVAGSVFDVSAQRRRRRGRRTVVKVVTPPTQYYAVPTDTVIRVRLNESLNSGTARIGDKFSTNVVEPVYAGNGIEVVPVGSKIWGRVTQVNRAQKRKPGNITVAFDSIALPNGRTAAINGSLTTLEADDVKSDNESTVKGGPFRLDRLYDYVVASLGPSLFAPGHCASTIAGLITFRISKERFPLA